MDTIVSDVPSWTRAGTAGADAEEVAALVVAARVGDRPAFERLFERYARMVHGILLARVARADADDLVQDVFLHAWLRLNDLRTPAAFGRWLAQMARRQAVDHLRRHRREVPMGGERSRDDGDASGTRKEARAPTSRVQSEADDVLEAIRRLPDAYREPLMLRLVEGMTGPEIAARTGLTPGSVRVNLHRGMARLREALK